MDKIKAIVLKRMPDQPEVLVAESVGINEANNIEIKSLKGMTHIMTIDQVVGIYDVLNTHELYDCVQAYQKERDRLLKI